MVSQTVVQAPLEPEHIPNIANFVYVKGEPGEDIRFRYKEFLSIYSAWFHWRPEAIYLHTNVNETVLKRCRKGWCGKWTKLVLTSVPNLEVRHAYTLERAGNDIEINGLEHKSDFVRVAAVSEIGGVYMDLDAFALKDVRPLRESGFAAVTGREATKNINSGVWMTRPRSKLIMIWRARMHRVYDGSWLAHSNNLLRTTAEYLTAEPGEALIMENEAFAPYGWDDGARMDLFKSHHDAPSMIADVNEDRRLPELPAYYHAYFYDRLDDTPDWYHQMPSTYILHSFSSDRNGNGVEGYHGITPRLTLEARCNFGIAMYPVAKHLFENGIIEIDDSMEPDAMP